MDGLNEGDHDDKKSFDSKQVFASFFSQENPFGNVGIHDNVDFRSRSDSNKSPPPKSLHVLDMKCDLLCTLEDLYTGAEKCIKIKRKRKVKGEDDDLLEEESKVLVVKLNPSMKTGMVVVLNGEGDEGESTPPGDIRFVIMEKKHQHFQRQDIDLIYTAKITLLEALTDCTIKVPTIRGKKLVLRFPQVINCRYERRLFNEGMPICDRQTLKSYGDMIIRFDIIFPTVTQDHVKDKLMRLLL